MPKRAKRKKVKRSTGRRKALTAWSIEVRTRDEYKCQVCGSDFKPQAHHILEKKYYSHLMLNPTVGITLCPKHHQFGTESAHKNGVWFTLWLQQNKPDQFKWVVEQLKSHEQAGQQDHQNPQL